MMSETRKAFLMALLFVGTVATMNATAFGQFNSRHLFKGAEPAMLVAVTSSTPSFLEMRSLEGDSADLFAEGDFLTDSDLLASGELLAENDLLVSSDMFADGDHDHDDDIAILTPSDRAAYRLQCGCCEGCMCSFKYTYFQAEALFLHRDNQNRNRSIVLDNTTRQTLLSTGDMDTNRWGVGQRYLLGRQLSACSAIELSYFGIISWDSDEKASSNNNLDIPPDLVVPATDFDNADRMRVSNRSWVHNAEVNWVHTVSGTPWAGTSLLYGFRYLHFGDSLNIKSTDNDGTISDYNIRSRNNLYGGQIGLRTARRHQRWGWDATGKAGVYGNDARQDQFVGDNGNATVLRDTSTSQGAVAFVGDLNASLIYQLNRRWALRGGYNLMWIEGVSLAGNQLDFSFNSDSGTQVSTSGGVFMHGASVGLQAAW